MVHSLRVAEPHHDGTPHWHLLLFIAQGNERLVRAALSCYALEVDSDEPGAQGHRFRIESIDPGKGSAVGYVAQYISKNIDGYKLEADEDGTPAEKAAERIEAWASIWRIRQFQQIGGPSVSVWRELRRAKSAPAGLLDDVRSAADSGQWDRFVGLMAGPQTERRNIPLHVARPNWHAQ